MPRNPSSLPFRPDPLLVRALTDLDSALRQAGRPTYAIERTKNNHRRITTGDGIPISTIGSAPSATNQRNTAAAIKRWIRANLPFALTPVLTPPPVPAPQDLFLDQIAEEIRAGRRAAPDNAARSQQAREAAASRRLASPRWFTVYEKPDGTIMTGLAKGSRALAEDAEHLLAHSFKFRPLFRVKVTKKGEPKP